MFHRSRTEPAAGQESVWDYPRPPRLQKVSERLRVIFTGETIADTVAGFRVLETSHPPVYYIPPGDLDQQYLCAVSGSSWCEFKGHAKYWSLEVNGKRAENAAWSYPQPSPAFADIAGYLAFYASRVDECGLATNACSRRKEISTVAGSPRALSDRSKVAPERVDGSDDFRHRSRYERDQDRAASRRKHRPRLEAQRSKIAQEIVPMKHRRRLAHAHKIIESQRLPITEVKASLFLLFGRSG